MTLPSGCVHVAVVALQSLSHVLLFVTPARLLCPRDFPGKNTGVGCHYFLQGIFPTQGWNPCFLHWQVGSLPSEPPGKPGCVHRGDVKGKSGLGNYPGSNSDSAGVGF